MNTVRLRVAALAATVIVSASLYGEARAAPGARDTAGTFTWAVVRVTVSARGDVEALRLLYQSGDAAFSRMALQAVSQTTFVPNSHIGAFSTFDYWVIAENGQRSTRIAWHIPGDRNTSLAPNVRVPRAGNAWLANAGGCSIAPEMPPRPRE